MMGIEFERIPKRKSVIAILIAEERDIVTARQRARSIAEIVGFPTQDQVRIATGVSELSRNAWQYAGGGRIDFSLDLDSRPQALWVEVGDRGKGIADPEAVLRGDWKSSTGMGVGLSGTRRLMDRFHIATKPGVGTTVYFAKEIPGSSRLLSMGDLGQLASSLASDSAVNPMVELEHQNRELLHTLHVLRTRETELEERQRELRRLNVEMEETNRGVVALYAELDEKATALRRADSVRSRFFSHMSHVFRTPVSSVLALTQLLLRRMDGDLSPEQERQVNYIRQSALDLNEMVNDILDFAKAEAGKIEIRTAEVQLADVFGAVRAVMRPLASNEAVALIFDDPPPHLKVITDETRLAQILRNLISNALKFTEQGEVRVRVLPTQGSPKQGSAKQGSTTQGSITQGSINDDPWIRISVRDTGVGVPPEHQDRIFEDFAQVENKIQRHVSGTGLGLPLSRRLAELMGGTLTIVSQVGLGSDFVLTLPHLHRRPPSSAVNSELAGDDSTSDSTSDSDSTILLIDDDATAIYLTRQLFRGAPYRIVETTDPMDAAERARFERPILIVLDVSMPGKNGFEVLEELHSDPSTRDIPVVIQTSRTMLPVDLDRLAGRPLAIMSKKPGDRVAALEAIRRVLGNDTLFADQPEFENNPG
jgi:signal transduction histidine kinase/CheY-like chemotaxis protein